MPRKARRWIAIFDTHGDMAEMPALRAAMDFCKDYKPEFRIAGGDHFDLRCMRYGASAEEKGELLNDDVDAGCDFLRTFRPTHYLWGNHERRIADWLEHTGAVQQAVAMDIKNKIHKATPSGCLVYDYSVQDTMQFFNYLIIHGFACGVNACRTTVAHFHENCIMGHVHCYTHVRMGTKRGISAPCMCRLDMKYADKRLKTLEWEHGFLYGTITDRDKLIIRCGWIMDGSLHLTTGEKEVRLG